MAATGCSRNTTPRLRLGLAIGVAFALLCCCEAAVLPDFFMAVDGFRVVSNGFVTPVVKFFVVPAPVNVYRFTMGSVLGTQAEVVVTGLLESLDPDVLGSAYVVPNKKALTPEDDYYVHFVCVAKGLASARVTLSFSGGYDSISFVSKKKCNQPAPELLRTVSLSQTDEARLLASFMNETGGRAAWGSISGWSMDDVPQCPECPVNGLPCAARWSYLRCSQVEYINSTGHEVSESRVTWVFLDSLPLSGGSAESLYLALPFLQELRIFGMRDFSAPFSDALLQLRDFTTYEVDTVQPEKVDPIPGFELHPGLDRLPNLQAIRCIRCGLTGTIPPCIANLTSLIGLQLGGNFVSGTFPKLHGDARYSLSRLELYDNLLEGLGDIALFNAGWIDISNLPQLQLDEPGLPSAILHAMLLVFRASNTYFGGTIPRFNESAPNLEFLSMHNCGLSGTLPNELFTGELVEIQLSSNALSGPIPPAFVSTDKLVRLEVANNFVDSVPRGVVSESLSVLNIYNNRLKGTLELLGTPALSELDVARNMLERVNINGMSPDSISSIIAHDNDLRGSFDIEFAVRRRLSFGNLAYVDLSNNPRLEGDIPSFISLFQSSLAVVNLLNTSIRAADQVSLPDYLIELDTEPPIADASGRFACAVLGSASDSSPMRVLVPLDYANYTNCKCRPTYVGKSVLACQKCPAKAICPGGPQLVVDTGWWPLADGRDGVVFERCVDATMEAFENDPCNSDAKRRFLASGGEVINKPADERNDSESGVFFRGDNYDVLFACDRGYTGRKCSKCDSGYVDVQRECVRCQASVSVPLVFFTIVCLALGFAYVVFRVFDPSHSFVGSHAGIFVTHCQLVSVVSISATSLPSLLTFNGRILSVFSLVEPATGLACSVGAETAYEVRFYLIMALPLIASVLAVFIAWVVRKSRFVFRHFHIAGSDLPLQVLCVRAFIFFMALVFVPVMRRATQVLVCKEDILGKDMFLASRPWYECGTPAWKGMFSVALMNVALVGIALPGVYVYVLRKIRSDLDTDRVHNLFAYLYGPYRRPRTDGSRDRDRDRDRGRGLSNASQSTTFTDLRMKLLDQAAQDDMRSDIMSDDDDELHHQQQRQDDGDRYSVNSIESEGIPFAALSKISLSYYWSIVDMIFKIVIVITVTVCLEAYNAAAGAMVLFLTVLLYALLIVMFEPFRRAQDNRLVLLSQVAILLTLLVGIITSSCGRDLNSSTSNWLAVPAVLSHVVFFGTLAHGAWKQVRAKAAHRRPL